MHSNSTPFKNERDRLRAVDARLSAKLCRKLARRKAAEGDKEWAKTYRDRARDYDRRATALENEVSA